MKTILMSRHTGSKVPTKEEGEQLMKEPGTWLASLRNPIASPIGGGKTVTSNMIFYYVGDIGGVIVFDADNLDEATAPAQKSHGLEFGWTQAVFPEVAMEEASKP